MQAGRDADAGGVEAVVQVCGDRLRDGAAGGGDLSEVETEPKVLARRWKWRSTCRRSRAPQAAGAQWRYTVWA